ncbi:Protein required for attachment to host cell [compost metagenome]
MKTWIAVINRTDVRIFETNSNTPGEDIKFITKLENPKGRLRAIDINADRPGTTMGSGSITHRGRKEKAQGPVERVTFMWARHVVDFLDLHRRKNDFDELNLIVEPHFLGVIRGCMNKELEQIVTREIPKELRPVTAEAVQQRINKKIEEETVEVTL